MSQDRNEKSTSSGRSRARGTAHSSGGNTKKKTTSSGRVNAVQQARKSSVKHRGGPDYDFKKIAIGGVILIAAIACILFLIKGIGSGKKDNEESTETTTTAVAETELQKEVAVDGISITGLSREQAKVEILKKYPWTMTVTYNEEVYEVTDMMAVKVDTLLEEIFAGTPKDSYTLDTSGLEDSVQAEVLAIATRWDKKPKNGSISSYDAASDKFLFTGAEQGIAVEQEKLASDISSAIKSKQFDTAITASVKAVEPEFSEAVAKEKYKTIASFTTNTTANSKRNTNVNLSAKAINGHILQPGQEFSFNNVVGERTAEKGYKEAAAYNNGEVVDEIGGGVCQTSSTLYNVVLRAGLKSTLRRSHTYEPSYVKPGTDAAVSWNGPDYKFVNNSDVAIGIRASYGDQKMTISIYGIPVLEEGVKYSLESTRLKELDSKAPTYEEDGTLEPGVEKTKSSGSKGSYWETRLIITKNGEAVSREVDHNTTYKGHSPVILRNTSGTVAATQPGATQPGETPPETSAANIESTPAPEGSGDGFRPDETIQGPGGSGNVNGPGNAAGPGATTAPTTQQGSNTPVPTPTTGAPAPTTAPTTGAPAASPAPPSGGGEVQTIAPNPMA